MKIHPNSRTGNRTQERTTTPLSWKQAKSCLNSLMVEKDYHSLLILAVGFYTGFRLSDLLTLKYSDFDGDILKVKEIKTSKQRDIQISNELREFVSICKVGLNEKSEHYLFTRKRFNNNKPISKAAAITRIKNALDGCGVKSKMKTAHTLRKTFALRYFNRMRERIGDYRALIALSKQLNHSDAETTRLYIDVDAVEERDIFTNFG